MEKKYEDDLNKKETISKETNEVSLEEQLNQLAEIIIAVLLNDKE